MNGDVGGNFTFFFSRLIIGREEMKVKVCNYNYNKV